MELEESLTIHRHPSSHESWYGCCQQGSATAGWPHYHGRLRGLLMVAIGLHWLEEGHCPSCHHTHPAFAVGPTRAYPPLWPQMGFASQLETLTQVLQGHGAEVRTSGKNGFLSFPAGGIPLQQLSTKTRPTLPVTSLLQLYQLGLRKKG